LEERDAPVLVGTHPHGIFALGTLATFALAPAALRLGKTTRVEAIMTIDQHFIIPLWREFVIALGFASVSSGSIQKRLKRNSSVAVVVGGARESLLTRPGRIELLLESRRGFFRLALQNGCWLLPCLIVGESELYEQVSVTVVRSIQCRLLEWLGFTIPLFYGARVNGNCFAGVPFLTGPRKLTAVFGRPVPCERVERPVEADIRRVRDLYAKELRRLNELHGEGLVLSIH